MDKPVPRSAARSIPLPAARERRAAAALLGAEHPLVRALDLLGVLGRQSAVVVCVCALARALDRVADAAESYDRLLIVYRPPAGVRRLRELAPELREVAAGLRSDDASARAVARGLRLLTGAYDSSLCGGRLDELRLELARIRADLPGGRDQAAGT